MTDADGMRAYMHGRLYLKFIFVQHQNGAGHVLLYGFSFWHCRKEAAIQ